MKFLEYDLEEIIYNTENEKLRDRGLGIFGLKIRQPRIGNYGIADIITIDRSCEDSIDYTDPFVNITIYELKKENINLSAFMQAIGYCKGISSYMEKFYPDIYYKLDVKLIGRKIDTGSSFVYLPELITSSVSDFGTLNSISNYTYNYDYDGISFKEEYGYKLVDENLKRR